MREGVSPAGKGRRHKSIKIKESKVTEGRECEEDKHVKLTCVRRGGG